MALNTDPRHAGQQGYRRPAVFQSIEIYENINGEWLRNKKESTAPITAMIHRWADAAGVDITFVSAPSFRYLEVTEVRRVSWTGVSILYRPTEVIDDGQGRDEEAAPQIGDDIQSLLSQIAQGQIPAGASLGDSPVVGGDSTGRREAPGTRVFHFPNVEGPPGGAPGH